MNDFIFKIKVWLVFNKGFISRIYHTDLDEPLRENGAETNATHRDRLQEILDAS